LDFLKGDSLFVSKPGLHKEVFDKYLSGKSSR
jgi:myo-inositol-1(or 4)-monophosphatase